MKLFYPGKMGTAEGVALVFGLLIVRSIIGTLSAPLTEIRQIFWLSCVVNGFIAFIIVWMMIYVIEHESGDIFTICKNLVGKSGAWMILMFYMIMFFANSASLLREYTEYTLVTALAKVDFDIVVLWFAVTVGILCYLGIEALARTSCILLPLIVIAMLLVFVMLYPFYIVYYLAPWQGNGIMKALQMGMANAGYNIGILLLPFLASSFQNVKTLQRTAIYGLGGASLLKVCFILVYIMVFGTTVGSEKAMPFFEMVRLVYLSEFIQRIEVLFIVIWVFLSILAIAVSLYIGLYLFTVLFRLPALRPIVPVGVAMITYVAMMPANISVAIQMDSALTRIFNIGMYGFPILLFGMTLLKNRRKKSCTSA